jgi:hypothetical protein
LKKFIATLQYCQGSQASIQGGHASDELSLLMHSENSELSDLYWEWAENHKTYVFLELGTQAQVIDLHNWLTDKEDLKVSSAIFKEEALNNSVTAISFVAPTKLCENIQFNVKNLLNKLKTLDDSLFEFTEKSFDLFKEELVFWRDTDGYIPIQFIYDRGLIRVVELNKERDVSREIGNYTFEELNFFLRVRFLSLKR